MDRHRAAVEDADRAARVNVAARLAEIDSVLSAISDVLDAMLEQQKLQTAGLIALLRRPEEP